MAAYAAVVSLMNNIDQIMSHHLSNSFDKKLIQSLRAKADFLLLFIEDCYNHGGGNKEAVQELERRIAYAAHKAEDAIESDIVDKIKAGTSEVSLRCSHELPPIIEGIDAIINEVTEEKPRWREENYTDRVVNESTLGPHLKSEETAMVGHDDELNQLLDKLTAEQSSRQIISIAGMGGIGKTTLVKNIFQTPLIMEHFDIRAWATICQQYSAKDILSELLLGIGKSTSGTKDELGQNLYQTLYGRRYLIVLDDIWDFEVWNKVRHYFPDGYRSRVVLTTRFTNVANDCGSSLITMNLLDEGKSWELFCKKASFPHKDDPPQLESVGKEIVEACEGLALSVVVIGGLLRESPRTVEYWKRVAEDIKSTPNSKNKEESLDVLSSSYSHLPPHLKPCFLYMGMFEEDSKIRVCKIIKLWIGEGFIKPNGSREMEEIAEGYINDLINRNLIFVKKKRCNGKIKFCGIHNLLRDLALKIAEEQQFFHVGKKGSSVKGAERRLVNYSFLNPTDVRYARSIIKQRSAKGPLVEYRLLRVFDRYKYNYSEKGYFGNVNMRFLTCKLSSRAFNLPSSVSLVWNLQTLNVKLDRHSDCIILPAEFWKMQQLRYVQCRRIYLKPLEDEEPGLELEKLQTLKTVVNLRLCEEVCHTIPHIKKVCHTIPNIKKLYLTYDGNDGESYLKSLCNLDHFQKLESLKLTFNFGYWATPGIHEMYKRVKFPSGLTKLCLKGCHLDWEDMTMMGSLEQLQVLKLNIYPVTHEGKWSPVDGQFLRLKYLQIDGCQLIDWDADNSHFPNLEKLDLISLDKLKEIPSGIGDISTLELIRVERCTLSAAISAIKIKEDQMETEGYDSGLQIQVRVLDLESLKESLKTEELLTTSGIQLEMIHDDSEDRVPLSSSFDGISGHAGDLSLENSSGQGMDVSRKQHIWIEDGILMPTHVVSSAITMNLKKYMHPMGYVWKMVPKDIKKQYKDDYMEELRNKFTWDPVITSRITKLVMSKAAKKYKNIIKRLKNDKIKIRPSLIVENVWETWLVHWDCAPVKKKSKKAKSNCLIKSDGRDTCIVKDKEEYLFAQTHVASLGGSVDSKATFQYDIGTMIREMQAKMQIQEELFMKWQQSSEQKQEVMMEQQQALLLLQQMREQLAIIEQMWKQ